MNLKAHFTMTVSALFFLGLILMKPEAFHEYEAHTHVCRMTKEKLDCSQKYNEYKINDIRYDFN